MLGRIKLDAQGQLTAEDSEGKSSIQGRAGSYLFASSVPDLMVLVRSPPKGGGTPQGSIVLAGDLGGFPFADLLAFLSQARWSGLIRIHAPSGERTVSLKEGEVRGATSDDPADRLGEVLIRLGCVGRHDVEDALREVPPSKVGRTLVERGRLQAHDLWKCLTHQVSEIFHSIVLCNEGVFTLSNQPLEEKQGHSLKLSAQNLLMDSIRKVDEMAHFRKRIPHSGVYLHPRRPSDGKLEEDEERVLAQISGEKTLFQLAQTNKLSEFDATKIVFRLLEGGYVQLSEKATSAPRAERVGKVEVSPPVGAARVEALKVVRVFNSIFREVRAEVTRRHLEEGFASAADAALEREGISSSPVLAGLKFDADGSLPEQKLLAQFEKVKGQLGSHPVSSFRKALSDVMFFLLFQAGELLDSKADEDLGRRVKNYLAELEPWANEKA